jgi:hypothetical protein
MEIKPGCWSGVGVGLGLGAGGWWVWVVVLDHSRQKADCYLSLFVIYVTLK